MALPGQGKHRCNAWAAAPPLMLPLPHTPSQPLTAALPHRRSHPPTTLPLPQTPSQPTTAVPPEVPLQSVGGYGAQAVAAWPVE